MCRMKGEVIKPLFSLKPTGPVWAQWTNEDRTAWKQMRKLGINKRTYDFTKGEAKKTTTCFQAKGWEPKRQQPLSRCRGRRRVMSRPWNSRWAWLLPESSSQTLIPEATESSAPPNAFSDRRKRLFPNYGVSQRGQTVAWQLRSSGTHMAEKEGCPGWRAGPEVVALVPPVPNGRERRGVQGDGLGQRRWHWFPRCPGPRMRSPGRRDSLACLTKREAWDRPGTPSAL